VYDNAGNETGGDDMLYGPRNLMTKHGSGFGGQGHWINYGYDGRGVRVSSSEHSSSSPYPVVRRYGYSPELHLLANYSETSVFLDDGPLQGDDYVWFGDQPVAQVLADASLRYTFTDHLGTPLLQTDPAASIVWRAEYEPYGKVYSYRAGDSLDPQTLRFPGQESDSYDHGETLCNVFRWYRAGWGRYTSVDPLGLGGRGMFDNGSLVRWPHLYSARPIDDRDMQSITASEINPYSYVGGNPVSFIDPRGLERLMCAVAALWGKPVAGHCVYGGLCIGKETRRKFIVLGSVTPINPNCTHCSPFCSFHMNGGDSIQAPSHWQCMPPMPIVGYINPNPEFPE